MHGSFFGLTVYAVPPSSLTPTPAVRVTVWDRNALAVERVQSAESVWAPSDLNGARSGGDMAARSYLRVSVARWNIDLYSPEAQRIFGQIQTDGVAVFRAQPGFVRYRLMRADRETTIAVAEWDSDVLGRAGADRYRAWMRTVGIMDRLTLETHAGDVVVAS